MKDLTVVTACYWDNDMPVQDLATSCKIAGVDFHSYGIKEVFTSWKQSKIDGLIKYLNGLNYEYVLFTDGFDSLVVRDKTAIIDSYYMYNASIVISAEKNCYPMEKQEHLFKKHDSGYNYPCAGGFMGKRQKIIDTLEFISSKYSNVVLGDTPSDHKHNDQVYWQVAYLQGELDGIVELDHKCELFLALSGDDPKEVLRHDRKGYRHRELGTHPSVIHFNGPKGGSDNEKNMKLFSDHFFNND